MVATHGKDWTLAPSLVALEAEVDARWPKRKKDFDGSIGDAAHAARVSEHNPDRDADPMPHGMVSALDITKDSAAMVEAVRVKLVGDARVWYVIHNGHIWSRTHDWAKRTYDGPDAHVHHLHVSLRQTAEAAADTSSWGIAKAAPKPKPKPKPTPTPKPADALDPKTVPGATGDQVKLLQRALNGQSLGISTLVVDGIYGPATQRAVAAFHRKHPEFTSTQVQRDPVIGPQGYAWLIEHS